MKSFLTITHMTYLVVPIHVVAVQWKVTENYWELLVKLKTSLERFCDQIWFCVLSAVLRVVGTHCMFEMKEGTASSPSSACSLSSSCCCWFVFCLNLVIVFGFSLPREKRKI